MPYTKSITASVTDRIDMLSDAWDVLKKISEEDPAAWAGMTSIDPMDRRWYSGRLDEWRSKNRLRIMSLERKENHVRVLINGDDSFFWRAAEAFEPVCTEYHASYEIIKVGNEYTPIVVSERRKSVREKCLEQLTKLRLNNPNNNSGDNGNNNRSNYSADKRRD